MKEMFSLYGIDLVCHFERCTKDKFDPQSGHYTVPDKWTLLDVEHEGESIYELIEDYLLLMIEKDFNAQHS